MTTGPDNRRVPAWSGYRRLSSVASSFSYVWSDVDLSGRTWQGKVRKKMTSATAESVTVNISASYSSGTGDTTLSISMSTAQLDALVGDEAEWTGWLGVVTTDAGTQYGLDGEICVENVAGRT